MAQSYLQSDLVIVGAISMPGIGLEPLVAYNLLCGQQRAGTKVRPGCVPGASVTYRLHAQPA